MTDDIESVEALESTDLAEDDADLGDAGKKGSTWTNPDPDP